MPMPFLRRGVGTSCSKKITTKTTKRMIEALSGLRGGNAALPFFGSLSDLLGSLLRKLRTALGPQC